MIAKKKQKKESVPMKSVRMLPVNMKEVEDRIAVIRDQEVIADADVAFLYGVETREVNQAVKNNPEKFPAHYMFELTSSELHDLKSKILISKVSDNNHRRYIQERLEPTKGFHLNRIKMIIWKNIII